MRPTIAPNDLRVYEPARRAQAVAPLLLSNRRDRRAGWAKARRAFAVNPLLGEVVTPVLALPVATDGNGEYIHTIVAIYAQISYILENELTTSKDPASYFRDSCPRKYRLGRH